MIKVKDLKKYLKQFNDNDIVVIGAWFEDGRRWYIPHFPCTEKPIKVKAKDKNDKNKYVAIGFFDNCLAHRLFSKELR